MGYLDNTSVVVDAILTKKGREILANGGDLNITKFALSDEEVDYTLWDVTHPNGTDSYGAVIKGFQLAAELEDQEVLDLTGQFLGEIVSQYASGFTRRFEPVNQTLAMLRGEDYEVVDKKPSQTTRTQ